MFQKTFVIFFSKIHMTKEEKLKKLDLLRNQASALKKDVDYYNALQLALKLVLNGSYAFPLIFG